MKLTLLSRSYCSLCSQMLDSLTPLQNEYGFTVEVMDVDDFPELVTQYDELIPVLLGADENLICHWHFDEAALRAYCQST